MSIVVGYDTEHDCDERLAQELVQVLVHAYPGHPWFVVIRGGVIHIKHMELSSSWGMCLHYTDLKEDATVRRQSVIRAAGEFLERAAMKRGAHDAEQVVTGVEGIPDKWLRKV